MKKFLLVFLTLAGLAYTEAQASMPGSGMSPDALAISINEKCPLNFNDGLTLQKVSIEDGNIVLNYLVSDNLYANVEKLGGILHDSLVAEMLSSSDPNIKSIISVCVNNKTNVVHRYNNSENKFFDIVITPDDLQ